MSLRKKRKLDLVPTTEIVGEVLSELDLEISLRQRLVETIDSRIAWALILQDSLVKGSSGSTASFKDAAFDALSAIEAPCNVLFTREIETKISPVTGVGDVQPVRPRPQLRQKVTRNPNANFLYIRSANFEPPYDENRVRTYLLRCPVCLRQTFTSLQGLFNHARLTHKLEWGTHDECVRACAVLDSDIDVEAGIEVGLGPSGILPGLRSLFQMAVGAHQESITEAECNRNEDKTGLKQELSITSHLTRTLGLHEDTPALAPFLGKQTIQRGIRVWGDLDEVVDIDGFCDKSTQPVNDQARRVIRQAGDKPQDLPRSWRMQLTHRNNFNLDANYLNDPELTMTTEASPTTTSDPVMTSLHEVPTLIPEPVPFVTMKSRFYFSARVIIVDRSLWIPPEMRLESTTNHTHKWMISIDSPSYSHHITTILKKLVVSSASDLSTPLLTCTCPPFVVVGTADKPFLAKVELYFSGPPGPKGAPIDQPMTLEHWVELDLLKSSTPVVGDEQVVDVELDKGTVLLPVQKGYRPIGAKVLWSQSETQNSQDGTGNFESTQDEGYSKVLRSIVGRFPMTFKETKTGRQAQPQVPYRLLSTAQFAALIPGRRKAIEWARARAICDEYMYAIREPHIALQNPIPLSAADVFAWLSEEGHFIRRTDSKPKDEHEDKLKGETPIESWCPTCGQGLEAHAVAPAVKAELEQPSLSIKMEAEFKAEEDQPRQEAPHTIPIPCNIAIRILKMPLVDTRSRLVPLGIKSPSVIQRLGTLDARIPSYRNADLVAVSDPRLTLAVHGIVRGLQLRTFNSSTPNFATPYPLDHLGTNNAEVEARLAPYATLAIVAKRFIQALVKGGLDASSKDKAVSTRCSDAVSVTDTPISTTSNENISSFEDLDDSAEVPPTSKIATSPLTPNGIKAGIAGGDAYPFMKDHIGWWYDWTPNPSKPGKPIAVPMLWGAGTADKTDAARLAAFKKISAPPPYVLAYEEPDCPPGSGSAGISVAAGVAGWESLIVPLGKKGTLTGSPSMCKQADETWLNQFKSKISVQWDITAIHINKNSLEGVKKDIEHYWNTYKKPIWVTEFACVNDKNGFVPCTNQAEINAFINVIVPYLESNEHVYAYAYSNGLGLGDVWPLTKGSALSASGKTYLAAISKFH
ncbi:hypothetical protein H0H81_008178 [Sphagnurus paluster]|uniref:YEATS domain-containing protein n=1 Tax=Sphagnurus paluster TaxID=117069 RepID=A0A9P7K4S1_9AGAR|nr:hypothetical protein H0H81_008178 [Sphagnurus paluster]